MNRLSVERMKREREREREMSVRQSPHGEADSWFHSVRRRVKGLTELALGLGQGPLPPGPLRFEQT